MQINYKALEEALVPISQIGQGESTFDLGGTPITLRVMLPAEELAVMRYASEAWQEEGADTGPQQGIEAVEYVDRWRIACLGYSIVAVGHLDLRSVDTIETEDRLEDGTPVKLLKHKALQKLVTSWTRAGLALAYRKYNELLNRTRAEADKLVEFEPSDLDAEIERLEERLKELKTAKEQEEQSSQDLFAHQAAVIAAQDEAKEQMVAAMRKPVAAPPEPPAAPAAPALAPRRTGPISPSQAVPPMARPNPGTPPAPPRREVAPAPPQAESSFINTEDDDSMNAALHAEHRRLVEMRRRATQGLPPMDEGSALMTTHPQVNPQAIRRQPVPEGVAPARRAPHLDAADIEAEVGFLDAAAAAPRAELLGEIDGNPVYARPAQTLEVPAPRFRPDQSILNPQHGGTRNPRFQPPKKP